MDIIIIVSLLALGIVLLLAEIFLLPGITIAGVGGALALGGGVIYAFNIDTLYGLYAVLFSIIALGLAVFYFMKSKTLEKVSLHSEIDSKVETFDAAKINVGDKGIAVSRLAPMGKVMVNNLIVEAKSLFEFIDEKDEVEITAVNSTNVEVIRIKNLQ
ncbi:MAG: NfeD family protein [Prevotellaceae bacterium]|jgi:membrane-bound ClpP family serine protease|nr:NfeD family protein [Prevotellaceae bacterium]